MAEEKVCRHCWFAAYRHFPDVSPLILQRGCEDVFIDGTVPLSMATMPRYHVGLIAGSEWGPATSEVAWLPSSGLSSSRDDEVSVGREQLLRAPYRWAHAVLGMSAIPLTRTA